MNIKQVLCAAVLTAAAGTGHAEWRYPRTSSPAIGADGSVYVVAETRVLVAGETSVYRYESALHKCRWRSVSALFGRHRISASRQRANNPASGSSKCAVSDMTTMRVAA